MKKKVVSHALADVMNLTVQKLQQLHDTAHLLGERIEVGDITIIPVTKLSLGVAGGTGSDTGAGSGITRTPQAFLVVRGNDVRVLRVPSTDLHGDWLPFITEKAKALMNKEP